MFKSFIAFTVVASFIFSLSANAQTTRPTRMDPEGIVDHVLCTMGLGCASSTSTTASTSTSNSPNNNSSALTSSTASSGGLFGFGRSSNRSASRGLVYGATIIKDYSGNEITLVRVSRPDSVVGELRPTEEVYEIVKGKKHFIPNLDIFYEYGFRAEWVQFISQEQLDKYRRIRLFQVQGDKSKTVYYLTDSGLRRRVPNEEILKSYGNRTQDIIVVSKKEFNYYPDNKFIHLESSNDMYMIDGDTRRYLTPLAIDRMGIRRIQIAPVNETEFNFYEIGKPVIN